MLRLFLTAHGKQCWKPGRTTPRLPDPGSPARPKRFGLMLKRVGTLETCGNGDWDASIRLSYIVLTVESRGTCLFACRWVAEEEEFIEHEIFQRNCYEPLQPIEVPVAWRRQSSDMQQLGNLNIIGEVNVSSYHSYRNFTTSKWCNLRKGATSKVNAIALGAVDRRRGRQRGPFRLLGIEPLDNVPPATWRGKAPFLTMKIDVKRIGKGNMSKKMKKFELEWYEDFWRWIVQEISEIFWQMAHLPT